MSGGRKLFGGKAFVPDVQRHSDPRGDLWSIDFGTLGFAPVRSFVVNAPHGTVRGGHGHFDGVQFLLRASGEIQVDMVYDEMEHSVLLTADRPALLISSPVWAQQTYLGDAPSLVVFCDTPYDPESYRTDPASALSDRQAAARAPRVAK